MKYSKTMRAAAFTLAAALAMGLSGCAKQPSEPAQGGQSSQATAEVVRQLLVQPQEPLNDTSLTPAVPAYTVADDFSNVINFSDFEYMLGDDARQMLLENGFVVLPGYSEEFFSGYEMNRYGLIPNFITTDSMMHTYHLFFSRLLKGIEKTQFIADLTAIGTEMQAASLAQLEALRGTVWENAAKRNAAFFAVGLALLDGGASVPAEVADVVGAELALISAAAGIENSPVMNLGGSESPIQEDYTQYAPRGYYTTSEELSAYFRAMMWYGRLTFRQSDEDQTRSALLMTLALTGDARTAWERIYTVTAFFAGASDDPGPFEYLPLIEAAYGGVPEASELAGKDKEWQSFRNAAASLPAPAINSIPIYDTEDNETATKGFRFMGQRFTLDASVFQQLIYDKVDAAADGSQRMLPSPLDLPAALGSDEALSLAQQEGASEYPGYDENMTQLREAFAEAPETVWSASLYGSWLNTLRPLLEVKGEGWPQFMQNTAWTQKNLSSFLGSWAELKHDTVLYVKQNYAEMGGGPIEEKDDRGWVEPEPVLFGRLAQLSQATADGLAEYGVLSDADAENLSRMAELSKQLMTIAEKELKNEARTDEEYELIRTFGGQLEHFWREALKDEKQDGSELYTTDFPAAIIADVATDPNGSVLEVGTGRIDTILVIVDVDGALRIAQGGVFSFYSFEQPLAERLTDETWRTMLGIDPTIGSDGYMHFADASEIERPWWVSGFAALGA